MKRTLAFATFIVIMFSLPAYAQEKSKEVMVKKIFSVLQQKNENAFIHLFPDAVTTREFILKLYAKDIPEGDEKKAQLDELTAAITDSMLLPKFTEAFRDIITAGEKKGIDWAKTKFISYQADSSFEEESAMSVLEGKIYFNEGDKEYFLSFNQVIWFENLGWFGVDIDRVDEKSKENEPDDFVWDAAVDAPNSMDTLTAAVDTSLKLIEKEKPAIKPKLTTDKPEKKKAPKLKPKTAGRKPE